MIYIIFLISITFHEFGHLLMSKILGIKMEKPKFLLIGYGVNNFHLENKKYIHRILIFLGGPLFNFILAGIVYNFKISNDLKLEIIYTNLILGIFNLLPIIPLDGGNILKSLLEQNLGLTKTINICFVVSEVILVLISFLYSIAILYLKNIWICIAILYLWVIFIIEKRNIELYLKIWSNIK